MLRSFPDNSALRLSESRRAITDLPNPSLNSMTDWWQSLPLDQQIFYGIGIISLLITVIQMLLTLIGLGAESVDLDLEFDGADAEHSSGIGLFSSQTISAFLLGFGWVGAITRSSGAALTLSILAALLVGIGLMFVMFFLLRALMGLQSKGNLDYKSAIGQEAAVYVTLPGGNQDGGGQIQVTIQSRLTTAMARKISPGSIGPGQKVKIVEMAGPTSFVVEPVSSS